MFGTSHNLQKIHINMRCNGTLHQFKIVFSPHFYQLEYFYFLIISYATERVQVALNMVKEVDKEQDITRHHMFFHHSS